MRALYQTVCFVFLHTLSLHAFKPVELPLMGATRLGSQKLVRQALICRKESPNQKDEYGNTPLHYAVYFESKEISNLLLDYNAHVDATNNKGKTALHIAAQVRNDYLTRQLIRYGASANAQDQEGNTPLHIATQSAQQVHSAKIVRDLLKAGAQTDIKNRLGINPLEQAQQYVSRCYVSSMQRHQTKTIAKDRSNAQKPPKRFSSSFSIR